METKSKFYLKIPIGYQPKPFPGLGDVLEALLSGKYKQTQRLAMVDNKGEGDIQYGVLGLISLVQGRLKIFGCDYYDQDIHCTEGLSVNNPLCPLIGGHVGTLPFDTYVLFSSAGEHFFNLAQLNAVLSFEELAQVLKGLYIHTDKNW